MTDRLYPPPPQVWEHVQKRMLWRAHQVIAHLEAATEAPTVEEVARETHLGWLMAQKLERGLRQQDARLIGRLYYKRGLSQVQIMELVHTTHKTLSRRLARYRRLEYLAAEREKAEQAS